MFFCTYNAFYTVFLNISDRKYIYIYTESNVDCGISEHLCTHLASLNLLSHSCPFHVPLLPQKPTQTKSKRWKKRGKGRKKQAHKENSIPVLLSTRFIPNNTGQLNYNHTNLRELPTHNDKLFNVRLWNARSVRKKTTSIIDNIISNDVDIFVITETWLAENDPVVIGEMLPQGYSCLSYPRKDDEHGGIGIIYKSSLSLRNTPTGIDTPSFEHACVCIKQAGIRLIPVYRPPPSTENGFTVNQFPDEFETFLTEISLSPMKTILLGDFNVHVDVPTKPDASRFLETLTINGFGQHIVGPTHKKGHTLDLDISSCEYNVVAEFKVLPSLGSDHNLIRCTINCEKPKAVKIKSTVRNIKAIDKVSFANDLSSHLSDLDLSDGFVDEMLERFNTSILKVLDSHAPPQQRFRNIRSTSPWYNETINHARREQRRCERRWLKSKSEADHDAYIEKLKIKSKLIESAKEDYYHEIFYNANNKTIYATMNQLLNSNTKQLPDYDTMTEMCNSFAKFFNEKVSKIRKDLDNNCDPASNNTRSREYCMNHQSKKASLSAFYHVTVDDVSKLIMSMPSKSCALDILPMWLLKENIKVVAKPITSIINVSLSTGIFPSKLREAVVSPLLKKPSLDKEVLKNYRPVSNISYVSKIMEKVVCNQIKDHLKTHGLQEPLQSAYRELHSTETALLRVRTDILKAMDDNKAVAVILLDLSAAFDTVDHALLLNRLHHTYGICDAALTWISSYLQKPLFSCLCW